MVMESKTSGKKTKPVHCSGKRKTAIARATLKKGSGIVRINSIPLNEYSPISARRKVEEALMVASDYVDLNNMDISVNVKGGGVMGQADAIASSLARGLVKYTSNDDLLERYTTYDRTLIAGDYRQTEAHKPSQSSKGPRHKTQKSYR